MISIVLVVSLRFERTWPTATRNGFFFSYGLTLLTRNVVTINFVRRDNYFRRYNVNKISRMICIVLVDITDDGRLKAISRQTKADMTRLGERGCGKKTVDD